MPKPRKFPLRLDDDIEVRSLEELQQHADLSLLMDRYNSGVLLRWLKVWGYQAEAELVEALSEGQENFRAALCAALHIPYTVEMEEMYQKQSNINKDSEPGKPPCIDQIEGKERTKHTIPGNSSQPDMDFDPDAVAKMIDWDSVKSCIYETADYYLIYRGGDRSWVRFTRATGDTKKIDMPNSLPFGSVRPYFDTYTAPSSGCPYAVRGNKIYYSSDNYIMEYDVEKMDGRILHFLPDIKGISPTTSMGKLAIYTSEGLYLLDTKSTEQTEIKAHGNSIRVHAKKGVAFARGELFFLCESSSGVLDDGKDPTLSLCTYGLISKKTKVVWSGVSGRIQSYDPGLIVQKNRVFFGARMQSPIKQYICRYLDLETMQVRPMPGPPGDTQCEPVLFYQSGVFAHSPVRNSGTFTLYPGISLYYCEFNRLDKYTLLATDVQFSLTDRTLKRFYEIGPWFYYRSNDSLLRVRLGTTPELVSFGKESN